jgi:hypothetical protein
LVLYKVIDNRNLPTNFLGLMAPLALSPSSFSMFQPEAVQKIEGQNPGINET